jgi:hypothetical protein
MVVALKSLVGVKYIMRVSKLIKTYPLIFNQDLVVELAVVLGKGGRNIPAADAGDYIGGSYQTYKQLACIYALIPRIRFGYRLDCSRSSGKTKKNIFSIPFYRS